MNHDEAPLTLAQQHRFLTIEIEHQRRLVNDARACRLRAIERRRRARVRQLREALADLAAKVAGDGSSKETGAARKQRDAG